MHHLCAYAVQRKQPYQRILQHGYQQPGTGNRDQHKNQTDTQALTHPVKSQGPKILRKDRSHGSTQGMDQSKGYGHQSFDGCLTRNRRCTECGNAMRHKSSADRSSQICEYRGHRHNRQLARVPR